MVNKHDFLVCDTDKQEIISVKKAYIELYPHYLKYVLDYRATDTDEKTELKTEVDVYNCQYIGKEAILSILLFRVSKNNNWCVDIDGGSGRTVDAEYKSYEEAKKLHTALVEWRWG